MSKLFFTMLGVLYAWSCMCLVLIGIGFLIHRAFGRRIQDAEDLCALFWLGWASVILFLQIWHLQFRVDKSVFVLLSLFGIAGFFWNWKGFWLLIKRGSLKKWLFVFLLFLFAVWLANRAICIGRLYDTGLYHLSTVQWIKSFPLVPGLGNLHSRLAFNNSYFLYAALLETGPWSLKSQQLAGGLLILVLFTSACVSFSRISEKQKKLKSHDLFNILMLTPILIKAFSQHVSSISPDLPVFALCIVLSSRLLSLLEDRESPHRKREHTVFFLITMSALGISVKLSFLAFGTLTVLIAVFVLFLQERIRSRSHIRRTLIWGSAGVCLIIFPWMVRGVILSGYLFYPSTIGSFPVEWKLSRLAVVYEANWVRSWARKPNVHWNEVLGNWDWFKPWIERVLKDYEVIIPLGLICIACLLMLYCLFVKKAKQNVVWRNWLFFLPSVAFLVYWFIIAPDLRFVGASFWILGAGILMLVIGRFLKLKRTAVLCFAFITLCVWPIYERISVRREIFRFTIYPLKKVELERYETHSGLIIYTPKEGDQCWNGPILCTPSPLKFLRLRKEGDISKGFILDSGM